MIKKITKVSIIELDELMTIWFEVNSETHKFINKNYWLEQFDFVKQAIQKATIIVYYKQTKIIGFIGLIDDYIAGIFVQNCYQNQGIGGQLLSFAKTENDNLSLSVYSKNQRALTFYLKQGFKICKKQLDESTHEEECLMVWNKELLE